MSQEASMCRPGAASRLWMHHALQSMDTDLRARYGRGAGIAFLNSRSAGSDGSGSLGGTLKSLVQELRVGWVVANRRHEPAMAAVDDRCESALTSVGVKVWFICIMFLPACMIVCQSGCLSGTARSVRASLTSRWDVTDNSLT